MANDDGSGFDYPIIEKGDFCIFDIGDSLVMRKRYHGDVKKIKKSDEFINDMIKNHGWQKVVFQ